MYIIFDRLIRILNILKYLFYIFMSYNFGANIIITIVILFYYYSIYTRTYIAYLLLSLQKLFISLLHYILNK